MKFYCYILFSSSRNKYYIGHTDRLPERLREHNSGQSQSTKAGIPWELVFTRKYATRSEAMRFENKLKHMKSRKYLKELIRQNSASRS